MHPEGGGWNKESSEAVNISEENTKRGLRVDEIPVASVFGVVVQQGVQ